MLARIAPPFPFGALAQAEIWCAVLQLPAVDVHDNFFDIGGHSISATRLVFQMRQALKVDLPLTTVRTPAGLGRLALLGTFDLTPPLRLVLCAHR